LAQKSPKSLRLVGFQIGPPSQNLQNSLLFSLLAGNFGRRPVRSGLRPPPRSRPLAQNSPQPLNGPVLTAFIVRVGVSAETNSGREKILASLSLALESPFPAHGNDRRRRLGEKRRRGASPLRWEPIQMMTTSVEFYYRRPPAAPNTPRRFSSGRLMNRSSTSV